MISLSNQVNSNYWTDNIEFDFKGIAKMKTKKE